MFSTLEEFFRDYRVKNGQVPCEVVFNRGPMRLKREIRELKSIQDIIIGNDIPIWNPTTRYEVDEYVYYAGKIYRSKADSNFNYRPAENQNFWEKISLVSLKELSQRIQNLETQTSNITYKELLERIQNLETQGSNTTSLEELLDRIQNLETHASNTTYYAGSNMNLSGTTMNLNNSITVNNVNTGSLVVDGWIISVD